ncbi:MAG: hypothetical protein VB074_18255 [Proteiniphilum sp.]|jgi:hypothetical protein|nr:hypothetical protein [Proteiniphilum sp.]
MEKCKSYKLCIRNHIMGNGDFRVGKQLLLFLLFHGFLYLGESDGGRLYWFFLLFPRHRHDIENIFVIEKVDGITNIEKIANRYSATGTSGMVKVAITTAMLKINKGG